MTAIRLGKDGFDSSLGRTDATPGPLRGFGPTIVNVALGSSVFGSDIYPGFFEVSRDGVQVSRNQAVTIRPKTMSSST